MTARRPPPGYHLTVASLPQLRRENSALRQTVADLQTQVSAANAARDRALASAAAAWRFARAVLPVRRPSEDPTA